MYVAVMLRHMVYRMYALLLHSLLWLPLGTFHRLFGLKLKILSLDEYDMSKGVNINSPHPRPPLVVHLCCLNSDIFKHFALGVLDFTPPFTHQYSSPPKSSTVSIEKPYTLQNV